MPSHIPVALAGSRGGHPLLFPGVALTPPGGWCPRLCTRQVSFSAHERDLEGRGIYGACLVWAPHTLLLAGNNSRAVKVGTQAAGGSTSMQQEVHTYGRQERRGKKKIFPLTRKAVPKVQTHRWAFLFCQGAGKTREAREASLRPACNSLLPADLGLLHRSQIGVIDDVLLPIPAPRQGGVLLQDRGILLLGSRIILWAKHQRHKERDHAHHKNY